MNLNTGSAGLVDELVSALVGVLVVVSVGALVGMLVGMSTSFWFYYNMNEAGGLGMREKKSRCAR